MDVVIGISAFPGGGKDFVADMIVKKYKFYKVVPGEIIRELMRDKKIPITRENETNFAAKLRKKHGSEYIMQLCYERAKEEGKSKIVIAGIRTLGDLRFFRKNKYIFFRNIFVDAPAKLRYKRIVERGREDAPSSLREFLKQDKLEDKTFGISKVKDASDYVLVNKDKRKTEKSLERIMKEILEEYKQLQKEK
jgi:dephospho-CoA kinase